MEALAETVKARWGKLLQEAREQTGETQVQLAARLDLFPNTVSRIERGQGGMETFLTIAKALDVDLVGEQ